MRLAPAQPHHANQQLVPGSGLGACGKRRALLVVGEELRVDRLPVVPGPPHVLRSARRHEVEVGDVTLGRGDLIVLATTLYGLDERRFPEPEKVDFRRADKA